LTTRIWAESEFASPSAPMATSDDTRRALGINEVKQRGEIMRRGSVPKCKGAGPRQKQGDFPVAEPGLRGGAREGSSPLTLRLPPDAGIEFGAGAGEGLLHKAALSLARAGHRIPFMIIDPSEFMAAPRIPRPACRDGFILSSQSCYLTPSARPAACGGAQYASNSAFVRNQNPGPPIENGKT
jgi:hypothetical protein